MADEIAGVGIRIDTDDVSKGITSLEAFASQGPKVEKSLQGVETSASKTGKTLASLGGGGGSGAEAALNKVAKASAEASKGVEKIGVSAGQTAQALRQLPAQVQDFLIQLQGGQSFLTAFSQQGSQIATSFGGVGNAVRSVGALISPLAAGIASLAAAGGVLALAYNQGANEAQAFGRALILSGNAVGSTSAQLTEMARAQSLVIGTQGQAAEALAKLASTGQVAAASLQAAAEASVRFARVGGDIDDLVKKFSAIGKDPLKAVIAINEAENFLTESVYKQVKALTERGQILEAATVAQQAYAAAVNGRSQQLEQNLGAIERAWMNIKDAAKLAWDAMLDIGRQQTTANLDREIALLQRRQQILSTGNAAQKTEAVLIGERVAALQKQRAELAEIEREQRRYADRQAESARTVKASIQADEDKKKAIKSLADEFAAQRDAAKVWADSFLDFTKIQREAEASTLGLSKGQARLLEYLQSTGYSNASEEMRQLALNQAYGAIAAEKAAEAQKELSKAHDDYIKSLTQSADSVLKQVQALEDEADAAAIAATGELSLAQAIHQVAIARLLDQKNAAGDDDKAIAAIEREIEGRQRLISLIGGQEMRKAAEEASKELDRFLDPTHADSFGEALTRAFDGAGNALAKLSNSLQSYAQQQKRLSETQANIDVESNPAKKLRAQLKLNEESQRASLNLYAGMAGAAKGFFNEGTRGYKALEAAETAFRLVQLASDLQKGLSAAAVGIATQAQGEPYSAWARMAAMAAAMAGLGFAVTGGFGGGPTSGGDGGKQATGTGTVLGDAAAKSESISKSIDRLAETSKLQLTTQSGMLAALRNIENSISGVAGLIVRSNSGDLTSGNSFGISTGTKVSNLIANPSTGGGVFGGLGYVADKLLTGGKLTAALFGNKTSITGTGLSLPQQTLAQAMVNSQLQQYVDTYTSKKFLGITYSTSSGSQYQAADAQLAQQFTTIFKSFYDGVSAAAGPLGQSLDEVEARLNGFVLNIGKIDLKDLTGEQIKEKLTAVLGAAADNIATAAIPGLQAFQKVGEGYFETLIRVASGVESATASLESLGIAAIGFADIGRKQGDVATEIVRQSIAQFEAMDGTLSSVGSLINSFNGSADDLVSAYKSLVDVRDVLISVGKSGDSLTAAMIRGAGGLDQLQSSLSGYFENFFSESERAAAGKAQLQTQFDRLGLGALPETREAFRALAQGIDTSTDAGQKLYAQVIGLAGAFADLVPAVASVADTTAETMRRLAQSYADSRSQLEIELMRANGDEAGARARERAVQLARDTAGLSADDAAAVAALYDYNRALRDQIDAARAAVEAQKAIEAAQKSAAEAAQRAAEALQRTFDDLGSTRFDLENQILGLGGNAEEVARRTRERDLAKLTEGLSADDAARVAAAYDYNIALQKQVEEMTKAQDAAKALADEQARAAQEAERAAEQFRQAWQSITDTLFEEVTRIRGLLGGGGAESLSQAQARFAITTAQARSGDQEAAKLLPGLSQTLLQLAEANATSLLDLQRIRAQIAASLEQTGGQLAGRYGLTLPKFDVGTNYVPKTMAAIVHEGEAIVPRAYNPAAVGGSLSSGTQALTDEVRGLREDNRAQALAIVKLQSDLNKVIKRWDSNGIPEQRPVEA